MLNNFRVGDKAVYPAHGVAEVLGIESRDIQGSQQTFYMLKLMDSEHRIMIPLAKAMSVGLRQVIASEEVPQVFGLLKSKPVKQVRQNWNRRYRGYLEKLKTGSVFDVAEVLRDLYLLRNEKPLSFGEKRLLDTARILLVEEITVATNGSQNEIESRLEDIFPCPTDEDEGTDHNAEPAASGGEGADSKAV